jgi:putative acyl-CoA dehydrogenase
MTIDGMPSSTHSVVNQSPRRTDRDEFADNRPLVEAVTRYQAGWARQRLHDAGRLTGSRVFQEWAESANIHSPELHTHDRYGHRIDEVRYHPAYHDIISRSIAAGTHALSWREPRPGAQVARQALHILFGGAESGHGCPVTMTHAVVPVLRRQPELAEEWEPRILGSGYDPTLRPAARKPGVLFGMGMTEKQGGSDVRANTTTAVAARGRGGPGAEYLITGHKWFCSAPMSDAFLVIAQCPEGPSCLLLPRVLPDGTRNTFRIQRLKDKLGNRSNASSEVEFDDTVGWMVGEPGRGVPTIIEMVNLTRLDCVGVTAGLMRQSVAEATWHAAHRRAFKEVLADHPLMSAVLADLAVEAEAATAAAARLASAYDADAADTRERLFRRLATAVMKYWVCRRGPAHAFEALECLGGNGYCESFPLARIYREQPLQSIWEGSGNVLCLDVLRTLTKTPDALTAFLDEIDLARGADARLDNHVQALRRDQLLPYLTAGNSGDSGNPMIPVERTARLLVERLAVALQASLLVRHAPAAVADAFCASRLAGRGHEYGAIPESVATREIVARHTPGEAS